MKPKDFIVLGRPTLAKITDHPSIEFADYERRLESMQSIMQSIQQAYLGTQERAVIVLEGWDTAGKGGIVRRLGWALDPRSFKVYPTAAPLLDERGRHYLQRFWQKLPDPGQIVVFDRSWYGRVLVERVEQLCTEEDFMRAYAEINDFEHELVNSGTIVLKFWLQIDREEQLRRFKQRQKIAHKRFKITPEDWRNRDKWRAYQKAAVDMIDRTSTGRAPWVIVPANNKAFARVMVARQLVKHLERALRL